jgi:CRP/FNR family transcriptional regulator, nitrogen oxide reductase regulator
VAVTILPGKSIEFLQRLTLFSTLSASECSQVVSTACEKHFKRRETVFCQGDPIQQVVILLSGCVKITQLGFDGNEVILRLCGPGDIVAGFRRLGANWSHSSTAQTTQPSIVLAWQAATFEKLLESFPALRHNALLILEERLLELEQRLREVSTETVGSRVSSELIRLSNRLGRNGRNAEIRVSRSELAQLTGTTVFTVSRLLTRWKSLGIVSSRREAVQINDVAALMQFSSMRTSFGGTTTFRANPRSSSSNHNTFTP